MLISPSGMQNSRLHVVQQAGGMLSDTWGHHVSIES